VYIRITGGLLKILLAFPPPLLSFSHLPVPYLAILTQKVCIGLKICISREFPGGLLLLIDHTLRDIPTDIVV
jgi:hypothetical protein